MRIFQPIISGSSTTTGSLFVTGSVNALNGFTGSLYGTASWAINALTASYVRAGGDNNTVQYNKDGVITGSSIFTFDGNNLTIFNSNLTANAFSTADSQYYTSTDLFYRRTIQPNFLTAYTNDKLATGDIIYTNSSVAPPFDLVSLNGSTWSSVNQTSNTSATRLLGIIYSLNASVVLLDGYLIVGADGSTTDVPTVTGSLTSGAPVYIKEGATSAPFLSTDVPTSGIIRVLGHLIYNENDYWFMRFRPDNSWKEV